MSQKRVLPEPDEPMPQKLRLRALAGEKPKSFGGATVCAAGSSAAALSDGAVADLMPAAATPSAVPPPAFTATSPRSTPLTKPESTEKAEVYPLIYMCIKITYN